MDFFPWCNPFLPSLFSEIHFSRVPLPRGRIIIALDRVPLPRGRYILALDRVPLPRGRYILVYPYPGVGITTPG